MSCPACGSDDLRRDYAPPRSYALMLLGLALLGAGRFLRPELVTYPLELKKLVVVGVAVLVFGLFDSVRHGNRFCAACGFRLRLRPGVGGRSSCINLAGMACPPPKSGAHHGRDRYARGAGAGDAEAEELDPNTPLPPIIACLKFKNPQMRREALKTLRKLTGRDLGESHGAWQAWYRENRAGGGAGQDTGKTRREREQHTGGRPLPPQ